MWIVDLNWNTIVFPVFLENKTQLRWPVHPPMSGGWRLMVKTTTSERGEDTKEWGSAKVAIHQLFLPTLSVSNLIWRWPSLRITATAGTCKCPDYQWDLISGNREGSRSRQLRIWQQRETYKESLKKQRWVDWNERRLHRYWPFVVSRFFLFLFFFARQWWTGFSIPASVPLYFLRPPFLIHIVLPV